MPINITSIESALQSKLNAATGSTESKEFLLLTKALESLNSGAVAEVATIGDLPTAADNTGRTLWVTSEGGLYVSNGTTWSNLDPQAIIDGAPAALDTLNELAAALGDDANFASTVTNSIATKMPLAGGTFTGDVSFGDNDKAFFGAGSDLQVFHDGSNSYILENGTGSLVIQGNGTDIQLASSPYEVMLRAYVNGAVELFHDGSRKLNTSSSGVSVSGHLSVDEIMNIESTSGFAALEMGGPSGAFIDFKSPFSDDYDGRVQYDAGGDGALIITTDNANSSPIVLKQQESEKLRTTSTGIDVTGELIADSYNETYAAVTSTSNATTVNCEAGNTFSHTLTENTTFTFSNPPASGTSYSMSVEIIQDAGASGFTVTWPTSVDFPAATAPTLTATASAVDVFVFTTRDGGTTWYGFTAGQALA